MPLKDGDIVTLDYEGRTDGILFDTTLEKVAKKEDALVENRKYAPITVIVGEGRLVPGFENDLKKEDVEEVVDEVPGFGLLSAVAAIGVVLLLRRRL